MLDPEDGTTGRHRLGLLGRRRRRGGARRSRGRSSTAPTGRCGSAARLCTGPRLSWWSAASSSPSLISREGCKPVRDADREVLRAVETVRLSAEQAHRLEGRTLPFGDTPRGEGRIGWYTREPVGVIGAITPFNDPLNLVAHKLAPALIGGNGVVLKPAEQTALTALAFVDLLLDAGVPGRSDRRAPGPRCHGRCRAGRSPARRHGVVHRWLRHRQRSGSCRRRQEDADGARWERRGHRPARCRRRACGSRRRRRRVRGGGPELPVRPARVRRTRAARPAGRPRRRAHRAPGRRQQERTPQPTSGP